MKYLFFDIECSDGTHMCSFGYVLTDENFFILKKEDILMNPEAVFHTGAWGKKNRVTQPGIQMAYPKETFIKQPTFPTFYEKIKDLITAKDQLVVGFSHKNDTVFLDKACIKYGLPSIDYNFYDVQVIHKEAAGLKNPVSTEALVAELGLNVDKYVVHKSDDDAEVSMLLTKSFCSKEACSLPALIERYPNCIGGHFAQKTIYKYKTRAESFIKVINRDSTSGNNKLKGNNYIKFRGFLEDCASCANIAKTLLGKKIAVARNYSDGHFREMLLIAQGVIDRGGVIVHRALDADIFADFTGADNGELKGVLNAIRRGKSITVCTIAELIGQIGLDENTIAEIAAKQ